MRYETTFNGFLSMVIMMLLLVPSTLGLRLLARYKQKGSFQKDDLLAIVAFVAFLGSISVAIYGLSTHFLGYATPAPAILRQLAMPSTRALIAGQVCTLFALGLGRASAVFFFRRIFCTGRRDTFDILSKTVILVIFCWMIGFTFSTFLACGTNLSWYWDGIPSHTCIILENNEGIAISSFILDVIVLLLPVSKIWSLHATRAKKLAISAVFMMALVSVIASCMRMAIIYQIEEYGFAAAKVDLFGSNTEGLFYQLLEQGMCLTATNLPSMWYLIRDVTPEKIFRSVRSFITLRSTSSQRSIEKRDLSPSTDGRVGSTNTKPESSKITYLGSVTEIEASG